MGLQVRKRTKGEKAWWNGSYSKKGVGASGSVKVGSNVTYNTGDFINGKTSSRLTVNFGNGIRYVSYGKKRPSTRKSTIQHSDPQPSKLAGVLFLSFGVLVILYILAAIIAQFL